MFEFRSAQTTHTHRMRHPPPPHSTIRCFDSGSTFFCLCVRRRRMPIRCSVAAERFFSPVFLFLSSMPFVCQRFWVSHRMTSNGCYWRWYSDTCSIPKLHERTREHFSFIFALVGCIRHQGIVSYTKLSVVLINVKRTTFFIGQQQQQQQQNRLKSLVCAFVVSCELQPIFEIITMPSATLMNVPFRIVFFFFVLCVCGVRPIAMANALACSIQSMKSNGNR